MEEVALATQGLLNAKQAARSEGIVGHVNVLQSCALFQGTSELLGADAADAVAGQAQKPDNGMRLQSGCQVLAAYISDVTLSKVNVSETFLQAQYLS